MEYVWVERDNDPESPRYGKVKGVYMALQPGYAEEMLPIDHPDVQEYNDYWGSNLHSPDAM